MHMFSEPFMRWICGEMKPFYDEIDKNTGKQQIIIIKVLHAFYGGPLKRYHACAHVKIIKIVRIKFLNR